MVKFGSQMIKGMALGGMVDRIGAERRVDADGALERAGRVKIAPGAQQREPAVHLGDGAVGGGQLARRREARQIRNGDVVSTGLVLLYCLAESVVERELGAEEPGAADGNGASGEDYAEDRSRRHQKTWKKAPRAVSPSVA